MKAKTFIGPLLLIVLSISANLLYSQVPQGFSYQAIIRDGSGSPIAEKPVRMRITLQNVSKIALYTETHAPTTTKQGVISVIIGKGTPIGSNTFASIPWKNGDIYINVEIDPAGGNAFTQMGEPTKFQSVPYALYTDSPKEITSQPGATDEEPIFVVKNKDGKIVFAVYQTGVRVYVDSPKGKSARGGFAVGGLTNSGKGATPEYFRVTPDSTRIFINDEITPGKSARGGFAVGGLTNSGKGTANEYMSISIDKARIYVDTSSSTKSARGGFAVGGLTNSGKGTSQEYFRVTPDSTRIYINDNTTPGKSARGGFAVGGLTNSGKGTPNEFLRISRDSARIYVDETQNKSARGGFAVGGLTNSGKGSSGNFLDLTPENYFIGLDAGKSITDGLYNSFLGYQTGYSSTTATNNVILGYKSGYSNVDGSSNVLIGNASGYSNTSGGSNVLIGDSAGYTPSTASYNVLIGKSVGKNNTTGDKNTYIGYRSGEKNTTGYNNVFIGNESGKNNDIAFSNVFIGNQSGLTNKGIANVFIGSQTGIVNEGMGNVFVGDMCGMENITGAANTFIGNSCGQFNTDGYSNVFLGNQAGFMNTTGSTNIFIGSNSGAKNKTGISNISIGTNAGVNLNGGLKNIFIGVNAGAMNADGLDNVFIGNFAGNQNTASSNVFIGRASGLSNTIGTNNVFIGEQTGRYNLEGSGNVFLGDQAGINEKGSNRLYISNSSVEKPLIYGEFDNGKTVLNSSVKIIDLLNLNPRTEYPGNPNAGDVFFDGLDHQLKLFDGTQWRVIQTTLATNLPPTVSILNIPSFSILNSSCSIECNIASDGGSTISEQGICYNTSPFFELINSESIPYSTTGLGNYTVSMTGLVQNTSYYVRAYAINGTSSALGDLKMFTTPSASALPTVITNPVYSNNQTSASGGGVVTLPGGVAVTAYGLCWNTSPNPTIDNSKTVEIVSNSSFISSITGLSSGITYYIRAYATNLNGTSYGNEVTFKTMPAETSVSDGDGNVYNILQIGTQTWMKENLKTTKYSDGNSITNVTDNTAWKTQVSGAYCWYNNDEVTNKNIYGALYNIYAVEDSRNLCPTGWHVPSDVEWDALSRYLGTYEIVGGKLKEAGTTHWKTPNSGADNSVGFTALPGGYRGSNFSSITSVGLYWTSTKYNTLASKSVLLIYSSSVFSFMNYSNYSGLSVRCVKD